MATATIALAGNPNSGKTTLFNALTGARQHVGNYPGVTVEKKQGRYIDKGVQLNIVDLPGTYSLTAYSLEEVVARDFLVQERPALVVNIVDAANLERNLYLTLQFMEMGVPVCIALNMMDVAKQRGITIDAGRLSDLLGVPVIPTVARTGSGKDALMAEAARVVAGEPDQRPLDISYGEDLDRALRAMVEKIEAAGMLTDVYRARWTAMKYLEKDEQIMAAGRQADPGLSDTLVNMAEKVAVHLNRTLDTFPEALIADQRYGYIRSLTRQGVVQTSGDPSRLYISDKIDKVVTHRFVGPLVMVAVILGLYHFTFSASEVPVGWLNAFFGWLGERVSAAMPDGPLRSMLVSGVIDGVGGVLGFVPLIMFMFLGIAALEDSGYLARVAFMLDRVFRAFGLHGSSVMAFIVSGGIAGGCAVPGVMAARTLRSPRERLATLLTVPFMNCGAKMPVFLLLAATFFPGRETVVMGLVTFIAWTGALLVARLLRSTVIQGPATPFVMELPPYRFPTFKGLAIHTWERTWQYIQKAGTVILAISILLWAMMTYPGLPEKDQRHFAKERQAVLAMAGPGALGEIDAGASPLSPAAAALKARLDRIDIQEAERSLRHSAAGRIGTVLASVSRWAGFDWRTNIALVGGFAAKEVIVSTLGTAYSLGEIDPEESQPLSEALRAAPGWRPLTALSLIIFTIFYAPCFVTVVCISREAGGWKWGAFSMVFNTVLAFSLAVAVYQTGSFLGY
jgi:ferrous iron transport protein B